MGLVRRPGVVSAEALNVLGRDALTLRDRGWRELRGNDIAMVLQDPRYALNPGKKHSGAVGRGINSASAP
ncbi:dipeptide transport ATP-binding protein DppD [Klebsiella michiganensis]|uniref:Dipeptide transport ATP-binding protein DppD n=1 Tax=Klebsiella michiganensis TaxID=1134687 RepID=A0A7H4N553_9ENTR|nr:dipeptide transport ATP-binding protein DppD [Klebsiella michiganensis]